jgi:hypothetical protein
MLMVQTLGVLMLAMGPPLGLLWSRGGFVGQKPAPGWAKIIPYLISFCPFITCIAGIFAMMTVYKGAWWLPPACALMCGAGICGIIGINSYLDPTEFQR